MLASDPAGAHAAHAEKDTSGKTSRPHRTRRRSKKNNQEAPTLTILSKSSFQNGEGPSGSAVPVAHPQPLLPHSSVVNLPFPTASQTPPIASTTASRPHPNGRYVSQTPSTTKPPPSSSRSPSTNTVSLSSITSPIPSTSSSIPTTQTAPGPSTLKSMLLTHLDVPFSIPRRILEVHAGQLAWSDARGTLPNHVHTIVGAIGFQSSGKSALLNWIAQDIDRELCSDGAVLADAPFALATESDLLNSRTRTGGVWLTTTTDGLMLLDTQPIASPSCVHDLLKGGHAAPVHEMHNLQITVLLLSICNTLLVVQEGPPDQGLWRFIGAALSLFQQVSQQVSQQVVTPSSTSPVPRATQAPTAKVATVPTKAGKGHKGRASGSPHSAAVKAYRSPVVAPQAAPLAKCKTQIILVFTKWPDAYFEDNPFDNIRQHAKRYFATLPLVTQPEIFIMPNIEAIPDTDFFRACSYTLNEERKRLKKFIQETQKGPLHRAQDSLLALQRHWTLIQHSSGIFAQTLEVES